MKKTIFILEEMNYYGEVVAAAYLYEDGSISFNSEFFSSKEEARTAIKERQSS